MRYFHIGGRHDVYVYPWYIAEFSHTQDFKRVFGDATSSSFFVIRNGFLDWYYDTESSSRVAELLFRKLLEEEKFFETVISSIYKYSEELTAFSDKVSALKSVGLLSDRELLSYYEEYVRRLRTLRTWGWVPVFIDGLQVNHLSDYALSELKKHLETIGKTDDLNRYYSVLSSGEKPSEVQKELLARLEMLLKIERIDEGGAVLQLIKSAHTETMAEYPAALALFEKHVKEFGWLTYAYSGPAMTLDDLYELVRDSLKGGEPIQKLKEKALNHYSEVKQEKQRIIKGAKIPPRLEHIFRMLSELMFIKDYRKGIYQYSYLAMDIVMQELARRLGMTLKEVKFFTYEEVSDALLHGKKEHYRTLAAQRLKECCYIVKDGKITVYQGDECTKLIAEHLKGMKTPSATDTNEVKGMIAYEGKVQGIAKIVLLKKDIAKMNEGDILVSAATNPDLIIAMKRAAGIVTDTGGIISHAAIVSRELKKPCVVGTQFATKVIHDGDFVELDADKGIIRIIEHYKD